MCDCVLSYYIHVRSLNCIVFDYGVSKKIIKQNIIEKDPCNLYNYLFVVVNETGNSI
jgi:hypothetical protein